MKLKKSISIALLLTNMCTVNVFASDVNTTLLSNSTSIQSSQDVLVDSETRIYRTLDKVIKNTNFKFKVPDYSLNGFQNISSFRIYKTDNGKAYVNFSFKKGNESFYDFNVGTEDLKSVITEQHKENGKNCTIKTTPKTIAGIQGEEIVCKYNTIVDDSVEMENETRYFLWKSEGIYYSIMCYDFFEGGLDVEINDTELSNIITSMKDPKEISKINYNKEIKIDKDTEECNVYVYDKDDLAESEKILGFKPKLIVNNNLKPENINAKYEYRDYDDKLAGEKGTWKFKVDYVLDNEFKFKLIESKNSIVYDEIKNKEYTFTSNKSKKDDLDITTKKLEINNQTVYEAKLESSKGAASNSMTYVFERDGIYYEIYKNTSDTKDEAKIEKAISLLLSDN